MTMILCHQKHIKRSTLKLRRFSNRRNYIEKVHQTDVDHSPIEITATKHVKMTWKFKINVASTSNFNVDLTLMN